MTARKRKRGVLQRLGGGAAARVPARLKRLPAFLAKAVLAWLLLTFLAVLLLRWVPPPASAFMVEYQVRRLIHGKDLPPLRHRWVDWSRISPHAAVAVIASEDQKFPSHWGFDFESIRRALDEDEGRGRPRGASTLSQQVVKNLFLWQGRSLVRKGLEAGFTVLIEALWPKQRILEVYLNIAEFGPGIYGVAAASEAFFREEPWQLTRAQAARLAAVLPSPERLRAGRPSPYVQRRTGQILEQMGKLGGTAVLRGL